MYISGSYGVIVVGVVVVGVVERLLKLMLNRDWTINFSFPGGVWLLTDKTNQN
ncbi:hypothetical protein C2G38_2175045 [Gigaspora rosea]|uniref:Uncharacterized protein n=1 Tax=Gigaspora rosea TaxID=44941 RepID=A0A397VJK6_9GLOM|nr:hypothetical protein C2G38_2175045 [Gigaspora rosea]